MYLAVRYYIDDFFEVYRLLYVIISSQAKAQGPLLQAIVLLTLTADYINTAVFCTTQVELYIGPLEFS